MTIETGTITVKRGLAADLPVWVLKGGVIMPVRLWRRRRHLVRF